MRASASRAAKATVVLCVGLLVFSALPAAIPPELTEAVLQIEVNGKAATATLIALRDADGLIWLQADDFAQLRLRTPARDPVIVEAVEHYPLQAIEGATIAFDEAAQRVFLQAPAKAFLTTSVVPLERPEQAHTEASFGAFLNYQLSDQRDIIQDAVPAEGAVDTGFTELGFFGPHGLVTNTAVAQRTEEMRRALRLESTWSYDFPSRLQTLSLGDAISSSGRWSRPVRFGGVQWRSNFAIRPDLVTMPLLSAAGEAAVPAMVDVFINNQHVSTEEVPAGPFVIDRVPAISGSGDVRLVVRDALGREEVISAPFYSSTSLLRQGLKEYSVEVGAIREDFAIRSNEYGAPVASGTYRRGLTDAFTLAAHAEAQRSGPHAFGADAAVRLAAFGVASATLAYGADSTDSGYLAALGFERSSRGLSFAMRSQMAGEGFRQIANRTASSRTLRQDLVQVSANLHKAGTVAVAYAMGAYAEGRRREIATLSHNLSLQGIGHVSVSVSRTWSQPNSTTAWLTFTAPLGAGRSASLSAYQDAEFDGSRSEAMATLQQSPPVGPGVGYRLSASSSGNYSGAWRRHFDAAAVEIEAAKRWQTSAVRTTLSGGATAIGGGLYATRWVDDSFALVDLGGISDIDVFVDNHVVGRTDDDGKVLISDLRSYDVNRISFNPRQLPLDARFVNDKLSIRPGYRSGVVVGFPIARERSATLRLIREDGSPAPAGAEVILNGQPFPIGLDGYVYVAGLEHGTDAEAQWNGGRCVFRIPSPEGDDPLPDMGAIICRTSTPH